MNFNLDCARSILLLLEEKPTYSPNLEICEVSLQEIASDLDDYSLADIANSLVVLKDAGFIIADVHYAGNNLDSILVSRITYDGYQFIESTRSEPVWSKIKAVSSKVGSLSIDAVLQIATSVITSLIDAKLNL